VTFRRDRRCGFRRRRRIRKDRGPAADMGHIRKTGGAAAAPVVGDVAGGPPSGPDVDVGRVRKTGGAAAAPSPAARPKKIAVETGCRRGQRPEGRWRRYGSRRRRRVRRDRRRYRLPKWPRSKGRRRRCGSVAGAVGSVLPLSPTER
jgi:hypothetical protein